MPVIVSCDHAVSVAPMEQPMSEQVLYTIAWEPAQIRRYIDRTTILRCTR